MLCRNDVFGSKLQFPCAIEMDLILAVCMGYTTVYMWRQQCNKHGCQKALMPESACYSHPVEVGTQTLQLTCVCMAETFHIGEQLSLTTLACITLLPSASQVWIVTSV